MVYRGRRGRDRMVVGFISTVSPFTLWVQIPFRQGVLDTRICDKVCQWLVTRLWFFSATPVSSTNKIDRHDITEILLKVTLNTINQPFHGQIFLISDIYHQTCWYLSMTIFDKPIIVTNFVSTCNNIAYW